MLQALKSGRPIPASMLEPPPDIKPWCLVIWLAFWELSFDRPSPDMRIPWTTIRKWFDINQLEKDDWHGFIYLIRKMDGRLLELMEKKKGKRRGNGQSGNDRKTISAEKPERTEKFRSKSR